MDYSYDIFLSYRHRPLDAAITQKTFHMLESYRIPPPLVKRGYKAVSRVFRDTEELAVSRSLSNTIQEALENTRFLVVICSPDTPSSEWVDREVAAFIELGRSDRIFPLLIAGDPETSFPPSLKQVPDILDRMMDVRAPGNDPAKIRKNEELALLRVIAAVSCCPHELLLRRHKMRKARNTLALRAGVMALCAAVVSVSALFWSLAEDYRHKAKAEQSVSMAVLEELTYALPDKLAELPGTHALMLDILQDNTTQILRILDMTEDKSAVAVEMAANLEKTATAAAVLGDIEMAQNRQSQALDLYASLEKNEEYHALLASAWNNYGVLLHGAGDYEGAAGVYSQAIQYASEIKQYKANSFALQLGTYYLNAGVNARDSGNMEQADLLLSRSYAILTEPELKEFPALRMPLANTCLSLGQLAQISGEHKKAEDRFKESAKLARTLFEETPNRTNLTLLARAVGSLADGYVTQAKFEDAVFCFSEALDAMELLNSDRNNLEMLREQATIYNNSGLCFNMMGDFQAADARYTQASAIFDELDKKTATPASRADLAISLYNVAENAFKLGDYDKVRKNYDRCLELYKPGSSELGIYHQADYLARLAYYEIIVERDYASALNNAAKAINMQNDVVFFYYIYGYALLLNNQTDASGEVFAALAALSPGEIVNVRLDFEAMRRAGIEHPAMEEMLTLMEASP